MNKCIALAAATLCLAAPAFGQITVSGLADKSTYADQVSFTVARATGWTYDARLDGVPVAVGSAVTVSTVDYHELRIGRTNDSSSAVETSLLRFIIRASERGSTENGLPPMMLPPVIPSSPAEFAGAHLLLITPASFPAEQPIPVIAWALNNQDHAVRANGTLISPGHPAISIKRGVGSGFLAVTNVPGQLDYTVSLAGVQTNRTIVVEGDTTWETVSGTLSGNLVWPPNSRMRVTNTLTIPAGSSLTIGAGTLVQLDSRVEVKLDGAMTINGSLEQPVVFFPTDPARPWGGFLLELNSSKLEAAGAIFTGSGAEPSWFGSNGRPSSHRKEQALFYCTNAPTLTLSDSAAVFLAGQLGHSVNGGAITLTRFLMQHTTTGGEFTGAHFVVNDSAFIECPDDTPSWFDGDNDALYVWSGTHGFTNSLFGWTKDDGVDSGGDGSGLLDFQDCWFESILHEGNSLSGTGKNVNHHHDVFLNCGQGLEAGYYGPNGFLNGCLLIGNLVGGRFGDNYDWTYTGSLRATNSILIHNYRDVWGLNWQDWLWRTSAMDIRSNWLSAPVPQHPENLVWQPEADAPRLASYTTAATDAPVGVGFAVRDSQFNLTELTNGLVVRLSTFTTHPVSVDYAVEGPDQTLESGTLEFPPGEILRTLIPQAITESPSLVRVTLRNPTHAELTGLSALYFVNAAAVTNFTLVSAGARWHYLDTGENAGTSWQLNAFNDSGWSNGLAELGYGEKDEATPIRSNGVSGRIITTYFRHAFNVVAPEAIGGMTLQLKRDDGGIVYLNGTEVFRSNMPDGPVDYLTRAPLAADDGKSWFSTNVPPALLQVGTNLLAVEIHQESTTSSDVSFDLSLEAMPRPVLRLLEFGSDPLLTWDDTGYLLEQAGALGSGEAWSTVAETSPAALTFDGPQKFYRLRRK